MKKIVFNGQFLARKMTGQERFAIETILELDKLVNTEKIELVVPKNSKNIPELKNIKVKQYGKLTGILWEQIDLAWYSIINHALTINLCSVMPILKPGVICIHDLSYKVNPQYCKHLYGKLSQIWHKVFFHLAWYFSPIVYTVSNYSKQQMIDIYHVDEKKIHVIENGWQHFKRVEEDDTIFERKPNLKRGEYFFMVGSLSPNKNLDWVLNAARKNADETFAIAGNAVAYGKSYSTDELANVDLLGYVSDGEMKALMRNCKAFIFPSFFEGFGIPPLEAMSVGAKVLVSNASCLPEIYGNSAIYIDPYNSDIDINEFLKKPVDSPELVLEKYSFANTAKKIYADIKFMLNEE